jgi:hypothetical protein
VIIQSVATETPQLEESGAATGIHGISLAIHCRHPQDGDAANPAKLLTLLTMIKVRLPNFYRA